MASSLFTFTPNSAEFPTTNFAARLVVNARPVLAFDASTDETAYWTLVAPQGISGTLTAVVTYMMASATSGKVDFEGSIEAVSDGDAVDLDATTSFDTANAITAPTVPGTAGHIDQFTITLTNQDSIAAGDYVRFRLVRDADDATNDTATGDCYVLTVDLQMP
jgi:hypothetical protein